MLNPISSILNNILPPKKLIALSFLKDPEIIERLCESITICMGQSRKEMFEDHELKDMWWVHDNFTDVDKNITPNLIITDNPQDCKIAIEISDRYQIPLIIVLSVPQWSRIRKMDRILVQDSFPNHAKCIMFSENETTNMPDEPSHTTIMSQDHLTDVLKKTAEQPVIL